MVLYHNKGYLNVYVVFLGRVIVVGTVTDWRTLNVAVTIISRFVILMLLSLWETQWEHLMGAVLFFSFLSKWY